MTPQKLVSSIVFFLLFVLLASYGYYNYRFYKAKWAEEAKVTTTSPPAVSNNGGQETDVLVPVEECKTPCKLKIDYKAKIRGEGHPLRISFPVGVNGETVSVDYPGEGDFKAPDNVIKCDTCYTYIVSLDEKLPNVRVQLLRRAKAVVRN